LKFTLVEEQAPQAFPPLIDSSISSKSKVKGELDVVINGIGRLTIDGNVEPPQAVEQLETS